MPNIPVIEKIKAEKNINVKVCFMTSSETNMDAVREMHPLKSLVDSSRSPFQQTYLKMYQSGARVDKKSTFNDFTKPF